ncbi:MAG: hypothetical protein ACI93R_002237 [Flavobacteriales bacterium]|jgi:hypothetical protein
MTTAAIKSSNNSRLDRRHFDDLSVDSFTTAPLRAKAKAHFKRSPAVVFERLADLEAINEWVPMIKDRPKVDHSQSLNPNTNGVGSQRVCNFGGDHLTETLRYWNEGTCYAYSVTPDKNSPAIEHLSVVMVESDGNGGSLVSWRQFFNPKPWSLKAKIMPFMMGFVMNKALKNLTKEFGGTVLK